MAVSPVSQHQERSVYVRRLLLGFMFIGIGAIALAVAAVRIPIGRSQESVGAPLRGVAIEPTSLRLTDREYAEGDTVSARFSIVNPLDRPVTIRGIRTSCSCMPTLPDATASVPFDIAPQGKAVFWVKGSVRPGVELQQTFSIGVEAWCDDAPLPECSASLSFLVEDMLKAYPIAIKVGEVPIGEPVQKKVYLYTVNDFKGEEVPSVHISGASSIKATIAPGAAAAPEAIPSDFKVKYVVDVTIEPGRGEAGSSGTVEILDGRKKTLLSIPVECWYKQAYRLSASRIDVEGRPGPSMVRELFFESDSPTWKEISVASSPDGVVASVLPYDAQTRVIRLEIQVPPAGSARIGEILLKSGDGAQSVKVPVRVASA